MGMGGENAVEHFVDGIVAAIDEFLGRHQRPPGTLRLMRDYNKITSGLYTLAADFSLEQQLGDGVRTG
jgi:hypothetical protein